VPLRRRPVRRGGQRGGTAVQKQLGATMSALDPPTHNFLVTRMTPGQRRALLLGVDSGGRLPEGMVSSRILSSIPEHWARTDQATGARILTVQGRAALTTVDRYRALRRAHPETGGVSAQTHADGLGMARDGLVIFQDPRGRITDGTRPWETMDRPFITERGRKLVGMPLTAPHERYPLRSRALWARDGQPDQLVQVEGGPYTDGTILVLPLTDDLYWRTVYRIEIPVSDLRPIG
jgi:hypothetical protein